MSRSEQAFGQDICPDSLGLGNINLPHRAT
jgi:hypothetical protein